MCSWVYSGIKPCINSFWAIYHLPVQSRSWGRAPSCPQIHLGSSPRKCFYVVWLNWEMRIARDYLVSFSKHFCLGFFFLRKLFNFSSIINSVFTKLFHIWSLVYSSIKWGRKYLLPKLLCNSNSVMRINLALSEK